MTTIEHDDDILEIILECSYAWCTKRRRTLCGDTGDSVQTKLAGYLQTVDAREMPDTEQPENWMCKDHAYATTDKCIMLLGQSNASETYRTAIESFTGITTYRSNHPGNSIIEWYNEGIQANLTTDVTAMKAITDKYIEKIVWFQGEADIVDYAHSIEYLTRTISTLTMLCRKIGYYPQIYIMKVWQEDIVDEQRQTRLDFVRACQQQLADQYTMIHITDTQGYERSDTLHLTSQGVTSLTSSVFT